MPCHCKDEYSIGFLDNDNMEIGLNIKLGAKTVFVCYASGCAAACRESLGYAKNDVRDELKPLFFLGGCVDDFLRLF